MKHPKVYARGKHAVHEAETHAGHAVLKVFEDERGAPIAQISLHRLLRPYEDFIAEVPATSDTALVLLGGIEDPHNLGAIIRSAAAFGAAGVLIPQEGQAPVSDTVLKVSAGMAFRVPLVLIGGYQQTLSDLHKRGFKIFGLTAGGSPLNDEPFSSPSVLVFGNESEGLPRAVVPLCDKELSIPMHARTESLNVAAAAAVALFGWSSRHPGALK